MNDMDCRVDDVLTDSTLPFASAFPRISYGFVIKVRRRDKAFLASCCLLPRGFSNLSISNLAIGVVTFMGLNVLASASLAPH